MLMPKETIERLHWALLGLVLLCIAGAVPVIATDPVLAAVVVAVGGVAAILGYLIHRDPVLVVITALIFPTIGLAIIALSLFLGMPIELAAFLATLASVVVMVVLTAQDPLEPAL
jgi:FtsH-binding integral membrane protein